MLFVYKAIDREGNKKEGEVDSFSIDAAIGSLQKLGLTLSYIKPKERNKDLLKRFSLFNKVSNKELVILSRQMSTLFEAKVSAVSIFKLLASETENTLLQETLGRIVDDIQGGSSISQSLSKHPKVFSSFYINMIKAGEESGKLDETFQYLADYMDRTYEVTSKARNALIYPAFVIVTFIGVMTLMFTVIIPKISLIVEESGQALPIYTRAVFGVSKFFVDNTLIMILMVIALVIGVVWYARTPSGKVGLAFLKLNVPYVGDLYKKLYLSRFSDNMSTMVSSGISMLKAIEVTASVIDNQVYKDIMEDVFVKVKTGSPLSDALRDHEEIPNILTQMIRVGEESGGLDSILKTMAKFYQREVVNAVDTLVSLIEPVMIVILGIGVGVLLASVLVPIYDIASSAA